MPDRYKRPTRSMRSTGSVSSHRRVNSSPNRRRMHDLGSFPLLIAGGMACVLLAMSISPTFAQLTASITSSNETAGSGYIKMSESSGAVACNSTDGKGGISTNSYTCTTINKYGGDLSLVPGQTAKPVVVTIQNSGSSPVSGLTLVPADCTPSANGSIVGSRVGTAANTGLCTKLNVSLRATSPTRTIIATKSAAELAAGGPINVLQKLGITSLAAGSTITFTFTVMLDSGVDNTYAGGQISQPLTWNFTA